VTTTFKLKRHEAKKFYKKELDEMYAIPLEEPAEKKPTTTETKKEKWLIIFWIAEMLFNTIIFIY